MAPDQLWESVDPPWVVTTIGAACDECGGDVQTGPFGSQLHASDYVEAGVPSIMPKDIAKDRISTEDVARITEENAERLSRYRLAEGDIICSRRGDVERRALVTEAESGWLCGTGCLRIRLHSNEFDSRYLYYYLGHPHVRSWIVRHAQGATMPNLNTSILRKVPVAHPPLDEQRRIAGVLSVIDSKIELNRKMNGTLEGIAQTLFRGWFVDFEEETDFVESELGKVPQNWKVAAIDELVETVGGGTPSTKEPRYWEGGEVHWTTPRDLSSVETPVLLDTARKITEEGLSKISSGLLPVGTVLLSSRAPVGYTAIAQVPLAVNQGYIAIPPGGELSPYYVLFWLRANMDRIKNRAGGTTFKEISKRSFRPMLALKPPSSLQEKFDAVVGPVFERITVNEQQSRTLAELRDTLLPKLISGEIRVPEAAELAEDAGAAPP